MNKTKQLTNVIIQGIKEKKGKDIICLDLKKIENMLCDYFIITHGDSNVHVNAIVDSIEKFVKKGTAESLWHKEGLENSQWVLLDYIDVVVHIFQKKYREFYDIESLWADAKIMRIKD